MSDRLFLNLWFPSFAEGEIIPRAQSVARQFPFSQTRPGISFLAVHAVSFEEPLIFQQSFEVGADVDRVFHLASEFVHADSAFEIEMYWDMWVPIQEGELETMWRLQPSAVRMFIFGAEFDDESYQQDGHIQFELGLDSLFLFEDLQLDDDGEARIRNNVQRLVEFTSAVENNCGISGRVLWSESEDGDNLAQKLIARLQRVQ